MKKIDEILCDLPLEAPSRDLVALAVSKTEKPRIINWRPVVAIAAAAAALLMIVVFPDGVDDIPTDTEIKSRISSASARAKRSSPFKNSTFCRKENHLDARLRKARRRSKTIRTQLDPPKEKTDTGCRKAQGGNYV